MTKELHDLLKQEGFNPVAVMLTRYEFDLQKYLTVTGYKARDLYMLCDVTPPVPYRWVRGEMSPSIDHKVSLMDSVRVEDWMKVLS
jgi:hypothetical protein